MAARELAIRNTEDLLTSRRTEGLSLMTCNRPPEPSAKRAVAGGKSEQFMCYGTGPV